MRFKLFIFEIVFVVTILFLNSFAIAETISGEQSTSLTIIGGIQCTDDRTMWTDWSTYPYSKTSSFQDSYKNNAFDENGNGPEEVCCCQSELGFSCVQSLDANNNPISSGGTPLYHCSFLNKVYCEDYNQSEEDCRRGTAVGAGNNSVKKWGGICGAETAYIGTDDCIYQNIADCICVWDNQNKTCSGTQNKTIKRISTEEPPCTEVIESQGDCTCTLSKQYDDIESGYEVLEYSCIKTGDFSDECEDKSVRIPKDNLVRLGFFNIFNFISAIVIIIVIYLVFLYKKKTGNKIRNKKSKRR